MSTGNEGIEVFLNKFDKTLLTGKNGHGKSTVYLALYWCLFGKTFDSSLNTNQIINSINNCKTEVKVEFDIGSINYKVVRGLKPAKFEIYINDTLKKQDATIRDYQNFLNTNILKMSSKTFQQIVILGSKQYTPFMRLKAKERRSVIEDLLDIQYFSIMSDIVKKRSVAIKDDYTSLSFDIKTLDTTIELTQIKIDELNTHNENAINKNYTELATLNGSLAPFLNTREKNKQSIIDIPAEELNTKLLNITTKYDDMIMFKNQISSNKIKTEKKINFFHKETECPTCEQDINDGHKHNILELYNNKLIDFSTGLSKANNVIDKSSNDMDYIKDELSKIAVYQGEITAANTQIIIIESAISSLEKQTKVLKQSVDTTEDESNLITMREDLSKLIDKRNVINTDLRYYSTIIELLKDGGIKTKIVEQYIPVINNLISKYLEILDFNVEFEFNNEFKETIKSRGRDIFSYGNFSDGQKIRIDLALLFTFREISRLRNSASTNLLIMDEIADGSMDSDGLDDLIKIINSDENEKSNIFIISHNSKIIEHFDNTIHFELRNNFSYMDFSTEYK